MNQSCFTLTFLFWLFVFGIAHTPTVFSHDEAYENEILKRLNTINEAIKAITIQHTDILEKHQEMINDIKSLKVYVNRRR
jgi:hypothetical protein